MFQPKKVLDGKRETEIANVFVSFFNKAIILLCSYRHYIPFKILREKKKSEEEKKQVEMEICFDFVEKILFTGLMKKKKSDSRALMAHIKRIKSK